MKLSYYHLGIFMAPTSIVLFFSSLFYAFSKDCIFPSYVMIAIILILLILIYSGIAFITGKESEEVWALTIGKPKVYIIGSNSGEYKAYSKTWFFNEPNDLCSWTTLEKAMEAKSSEEKRLNLNTFKLRD